MIEEKGLFDRFVDAFIYFVAGFLALICMLPFFNVIAKSLSGAEASR
jgi:hypothetical protein